MLQTKKRKTHGGIKRRNPAIPPEPKDPVTKPGPDPQPSIKESPRRKKVKNKKYDYINRAEKKIEEMIDAAKEEKKNLEIIQKEREAAQEALDRQKELLKKGMSVKDKARMVAGIFKEMDFEPIEEAIRLVQGGGLDPKTKAALIMKLAEWTTPKPKSIDIQKDEEGNVTINRISFEGASQESVKNQPDDKEFDEFVDEEDKTQD